MIEIILLSMSTLAPQQVSQATDGQWYVVQRVETHETQALEKINLDQYASISPMRGIQVSAPAKDGEMIRWVVHFPSNSDQVSMTDAARLRAMAKRYPAYRVTGHTDLRGTNAYNLNLSKRRAEHVEKILRAAGAKRIAVEYYGETQPICREATPACDQKNRRVVVRSQENQDGS